jgi:hypothetical protein
MIFKVLGILSSIIFFVGDMPYFIEALKGKIKPHRISWGIAFLLSIIGFANQFAAGARNSLWIVGAAIIAVGAIFTVSIFKGTGGKAKQDIIALTISLMGVVMWIIAKNPAVSIMANIFASFVGMYPTILKAKNHPETEHVSAFLFGSISSAIAMISVGKLDFILLVGPLFGAIIQAYLVYLISFRPKQIATTTQA